MPGIMELSQRLRWETVEQASGPSFTVVSPESIAAAPSDYSAPERRI
jgi:hypothetical protein